MSIRFNLQRFFAFIPVLTCLTFVSHARPSWADSEPNNRPPRPSAVIDDDVLLYIDGQPLRFAVLHDEGNDVAKPQDNQYYILPVFAPIAGNDGRPKARAAGRLVQIDLVLVPPAAQEAAKKYLAKKNHLPPNVVNVQIAPLDTISFLPVGAESSVNGINFRSFEHERFSTPTVKVVGNATTDEAATKFVDEFEKGTVGLEATMTFKGVTYEKNYVNFSWKSIANTTAVTSLKGPSGALPQSGQGAVVDRAPPPVNRYQLQSALMNALSQVNAYSVIEFDDKGFKDIVQAAMDKLDHIHKEDLDGNVAKLNRYLENVGFDPNDLKADILKQYKSKYNENSSDYKHLEDKLNTWFKEGASGEFKIKDLVGGSASENVDTGSISAAVRDTLTKWGVSFDVSKDGLIIRPKSIDVATNRVEKLNVDDEVRLESRKKEPKAGVIKAAPLYFNDVAIKEASVKRGDFSFPHLDAYCRSGTSVDLDIFDGVVGPTGGTHFEMTSVRSDGSGFKVEGGLLEKSGKFGVGIWASNLGVHWFFVGIRDTDTGATALMPIRLHVVDAIPDLGNERSAELVPVIPPEVVKSNGPSPHIFGEQSDSASQPTP